MLRNSSDVLVGGAGDRVGAQQGLPVHLEADHGELAAGEAEGGIAGGLEGEQAIGPVVNVGDFRLQQIAHNSVSSRVYFAAQHRPRPACLTGLWKDFNDLDCRAAMPQGQVGGGSAGRLGAPGLCIANNSHMQ